MFIEHFFNKEKKCILINLWFSQNKSGEICDLNLVVEMIKHNGKFALAL